MRTIIVGLGIQGTKRREIGGADVVATVDAQKNAEYKSVEEVPLTTYDAALVCTPDDPKGDILRYLLLNKKHVLVEKPLLLSDEVLRELNSIADRNHLTCYTAYNHRFEPHIVTLKDTIERNVLGKLYYLKVFYGNGTARNVRNSPWRDTGLGVFSDIGSHLFDLLLYFFGERDISPSLWSASTFENRAFDHVVIGGNSEGMLLQLEATLLSWKNTFRLDIVGEYGSAHIEGLCKWGPSTFSLRTRIIPSGAPRETCTVLSCPDPTWSLEYNYFKELCVKGGNTLDKDQTINRWLRSCIK